MIIEAGTSSYERDIICNTYFHTFAEVYKVRILHCNSWGLLNMNLYIIMNANT